MLSFRAGFVKGLLQNRHLLQFKLKEEKVDWLKYESVVGFRQMPLLSMAIYDSSLS